MTDLLDQLEEAKHRIVKAQPETSRVFDFTYVFKLNGKWHDGQHTGRPTSCASHMTNVIARLGGDIEKIRWTRGYLDGDVLKIHPKTDSIAERELFAAMKRYAKKADAAAKRKSRRR